MSDDEMPHASAATLARARLLAGHMSYVESLPGLERRVAELAAQGEPNWEIAAEVGISGGAVASMLDRIVGAIGARSGQRPEVGGLGADTDPGISGGYDDAPWEAFDGPEGAGRDGQAR
ncbi:MAG: LuxR C-terminal-related transcriptional regulator [Chloroflexota bacterium]